MNAATSILALLLLTSCAGTSSRDADLGTRELSRYVVLHRGIELDVSVGFRRAAQGLGDEWLILAVEFTSAPRSGPTTVSRTDITVFTPDGRRLVLIGQDEFRKIYGRIRVAVERALRALPILGRYDTSQMPCDRWFLTDPFGGFAYEEISVNTFQVCSGPLVFSVPGGVQPGRWRLVIELEESRVDIPFELEAPD
jgi:hypothetical protein